MRLYVLGSGSTGNAVLVQAGDTRVLVDAGLGPVACVKRLRALGADLFPRGVDALVVTHEHADHAGHVLPLAKALRCPLVLHDGIAAPVARRRFPVVRLGGGPVDLGELRIEAFPLPHDAPNVALRLSSRDRSVAYATDLGHAPAGLAPFLAASDAVLFEANHCHEALAVGPYTERLRRRISSNVGHLSNVEAGLLVRDVRALGDPLVALCHLSQVNNSPELALRDVGRLAPLARLTVLPHGEPVVVDVERARTRAAVQLALGLG